MRSCEGLCPNIPHRKAGIRKEPAISVPNFDILIYNFTALKCNLPIPIGDPLAAIIQASPPEEPPVFLVVS